MAAARTNPTKPADNGGAPNNTASGPAAAPGTAPAPKGPQAGQGAPRPQRPDLAKLAAPFPGGFIEHTPVGGGRRGEAYVAHHVVNQWLLGILGPFDFELVEAIRGDVAAVPGDPTARSERWRQGTPELHNVIVGAVYRLTVDIDGRRTVIEEIGDVEDPHNWKHDGARLKMAASDALKRCAMRIGLGLHLWAQEHYVLDQRLTVVGGTGNAPAESPAQAEKPRQPQHEQRAPSREAREQRPAKAS